MLKILRYTLPALLSMFLSFCGEIFCASVTPLLISNYNNIFFVRVACRTGSFTKVIPISIVNCDVEKTACMVWILHGYKPSGDPYSQDPGIIIRNWKLAGLSRRFNASFYLPDMGATVYPMHEIRDLFDVFLYYKSEAMPGKIIFAGISTGSEGAVKLASLYSGGAELVCISGTFDFTGLDRLTGEYRIHEKVFKSHEDWEGENPLGIMREMKNTRVYVFSEENSIFNAQALDLLNAGLTNIEIVDKTALGKGFSHNWNFWKSPGLYSNLSLIFSSGLFPGQHPD
jgi:esterase/lipase superfamily enzyme